jgi:hypothetical protein
VSDLNADERFENTTFSTGETLYVAPEVLWLMGEGVDIEKLFVESHSRGDGGLYSESLEEIAAHVARIADEATMPPIISAHRVEEHGYVVVFLSDRHNKITHIFGLEMGRLERK